MSMTRKQWSVNALGVELCVDRRTIARRLANVTPAGAGPNGPTYWLSDCVRTLGYGCSCRSTPADTRSFHTSFYLQGFEEERDEWAELASELAPVTDPGLIARRIRETLLARLWDNERTGDEPRCPDLRAASDADFDAAWTSLVWEGGTFAEVAAMLPAAPAPKKKAARKAT